VGFRSGGLGFYDSHKKSEIHMVWKWFYTIVLYCLLFLFCVSNSSKAKPFFSPVSYVAFDRCGGLLFVSLLSGNVVVLSNEQGKGVCSVIFSLKSVRRYYPI
jgi:hypothetical protein